MGIERGDANSLATRANGKSAQANDIAREANRIAEAATIWRPGPIGTVDGEEVSEAVARIEAGGSRC